MMKSARRLSVLLLVFAMLLGMAVPAAASATAATYYGSYPNDPSNITASDDNYIYYVDSLNIYRFDKQTGGNKTLIYTATSHIAHVAAKDGWVYFAMLTSTFENNSYQMQETIYKLRWDGTGLTALISVRQIYSMVLVDNKIYYAVSGPTIEGTYGRPESVLYSINLDGSGNTKLHSDNETMWYMVPHGDKLYLLGRWVNNSNLMALDRATGTVNYLQRDMCYRYTTSNLVRDGNYLYFIRSSDWHPSALMRCGLDGSGLQEVPVDFELRVVVPVDGAFYYYDSASGHVYRSTLTGSGKGTQITAKPSQSRSFAYQDGWIITHDDWVWVG